MIEVASKGFDFKPAIILVLVGGNDVSCSFGLSALNAGRKGRQQTNLKVFEEEFDELLALLSKFEAPIGLYNLKPMGEDISSHFNDRIRDYNSALATLAAKFPLATVIDVYTPFVAEITARAPTLKYKAPPATKVEDIVNPARIVKVVSLRYLSLGFLSWDTLGEMEGFSMSSDGIHCNERAGAIFLQHARQFVDANLR